MKLLISLFIAICSFTFGLAQETPQSTEKHVGIALNSFGIGLAELVFISPSVSYYQNKHQFELGAGLGLPIRDYDRSFCTNVNYTFFPVGIGKRIHLYTGVDLNYFHLIDDSYPGPVGEGEIKVNQVSMFGGIGAQLKFIKKAYFGLSFYMGAATSQMIYSYYYNPSTKERLFVKYKLDGLLKVSVGYRF